MKPLLEGVLLLKPFVCLFSWSISKKAVGGFSSDLGNGENTDERRVN